VAVLRFVVGSLSCMLPLPLLNSIEVVKIRLQLQNQLQTTAIKRYNGMFHGIFTIFSQEGIRGLYKGITPAALREGTYAGLRMGLYEPLKKLLGEERSKGTELGILGKIVSGSVAGGVGAAIANPTDLIKIRMQAEGPEDIPRYKSTVHAFSTIIKNEGFLGLYRGTIATTQRAMIISAAMMPTYDHSKHYLREQGIFPRDNIYAHFCSGMMAGFTMAVVTSPIDVAKTRIMNQMQNAEFHAGEYKFRGLTDCLLRTARSEGLVGLYKGFIPNWGRLGPHTTLAMMCFEQLRKLVGIQPV